VITVLTGRVWTDTSALRQSQAQLRQALDQLELEQGAHENLRRQLADQALRDPASGLHTRAHLEEQLRREVDLSTREHREFSLVFIEIDPAGPKLQAAGPASMQSVLGAAGRLLRSGTRAMDSSCRLEDRRFGVLLSGVGLATAHARMEGLRRRGAAEIVVHQGQDLGYTVSIGVASFPHTAQSQDELVVACTAALAEAQRRGGNHVTLASICFPGA
jgi:diguanylate cyclase (GGDEF)-like protein